MKKARYAINFPQHMAECEANYYRLKRLMPNAYRKTNPEKEWFYVFGLQDSTNFSICVTERAKYTTTVHILVDVNLQNTLPWSENTSSVSHLQNNLHQFQYEMTVRVYHDALMAEVFAWDGLRCWQAYYDYPNSLMYQPDEKSQQNHLLKELLEQCLVQGRLGVTV